MRFIRFSPLAGLITGAILLVFGLVFGGIAWFVSSDARALRTSGVKAQAEVTEVVRNVRTRVGRPDSITFCARLSYAVNGARQSFQGACTNPATYKTGDKVEVLYDPATPTRVLINTFSEQWLFPLIFAAAAVVALLLGLLGVLRSLFRLLRAGAGLAAWAATRRN